MDRIDALTAYGDRTKVAADNMPRILSNPAMTIDEAERLYAETESAAQELNAFVASMGEGDVDDAFIEAGEKIQQTWTKLLMGALNKLRELRGLSAIELPEGR
jgi:hypothetical protein